MSVLPRNKLPCKTYLSHANLPPFRGLQVGKSVETALQDTLRNDLVRQVGQLDSLRAWVEAYFALEVTTSDSSRKVQRRDLGLLAEFLDGETGSDRVDDWTPRFSRAFLNSLRNTVDEDGSRHSNDRTLNRVIAHLKTFAKWVHRHRPFRLGDPMAKAGVQGKTPHSARHAMGRHLADRFGNVEAVQRQLGHKNAAYPFQYTRVTAEELERALDDRDS